MADVFNRFWSKVERTDGCWLWKGKLNNSGYGSFYENHTVIGVHRFSYREFVGPLAEGLDVCHSCDTRNCVRPDHLWLGSRAENLEDMTNKGRRVTVIAVQDGEQNRAAKLTWNLVDQIRDLWAQGKSQKQIEVITGVPRQNVYNVVYNKSWVRK